MTNMKIHFLIMLMAAIWLYTGVFCMNGNQANQTNLSNITGALPEDINGWSAGGEDRIYTSENLFEYINGGAELYISYGVEKVFNRTFAREGQPEIIVDIFDMANSSNAFGIFSHSRETVEAELGQGSQYTEGLFLFWKDRYYVSILASPETNESKATMFELARRIESAIPQEGRLPELLNLLPRERLQEESIRFFHHYIWLNSHYFVANDNILFIDDSTDAVLAKYGRKGRPSILLLVRYTNEDDANRARDSFVENYLPESSDSRVVEMADGSWTGYGAANAVLAVVFAAEDESAARELLNRSLENCTENKSHSP